MEPLGREGWTAERKRDRSGHSERERQVGYGVTQGETGW